jgi:predicted DNA-binding transcriptional regulator YafY
MVNKKKHSYDKALYRLVGIISMLLKDERPTIKSLSEEFNVSIRTIQKDVYERLIQFNITKDSLGQLKFAEGFAITQLELKKAS